MDRAIGLTGEQLERVCRGAVLDLFGRIITKTPVDTGFARGNWNLSFDKPDAGVSSEHADKGGGKVYARALAVAGQVPMAGRVMWITNGVPYINRLEYGHSKQAPAGMVRISLVEVSNSLNRALK